MNKQKLRESLYYHVRLWPISARKVPHGPWLPQIDDDWFVRSVDTRGIVEIGNPRTGHIAILGSDRIHHFEHEPHRDIGGSKYGLYVLQSQLVLCGNNVFYLPHQQLHAH